MSSTIQIFTLALAGSMTACMAEVEPYPGDAVDEGAADERDAVAAQPPAEPPDGIRVERPPVRTDGTFYYVPAKHSDKCLHQQRAVMNNGAPITQWDCVDQYNVQWEFEPSSDPGWYFIKARHSGKCAHQHGHSYANGDAITQWDCVDQGNVKWRFIPAANNYFYLEVQHSGKCMHVHGGGWGNGDPITQWTCINQPNVLWTFEPVGH